jgi:omega-6 fatty acid desaturase (delta-12 desaturase)
MFLLAASFYCTRHTPWLSAVLSVPIAGFIVRLFIIQHDCGHHSLFPSARANDWVGRAISIVTLTPYTYWRLQHACHHATSGNQDRRGTGDIAMLMVTEYQRMSMARRISYRVYRHPLVLFGLGPIIQYSLLYRFPFPTRHRHKHDRRSILGTDLVIAVVYFVVIRTLGISAIAFALLPPLTLAASAGVWLFYVQHHFPGTYWERAHRWEYTRAAIAGSSLYDLPRPLHWLTANIGFHHIHHLCSRIPSYNLPRCYSVIPELQAVTHLSILDSLRCARMLLWNEQRQELVTIRNIHS